MMAPFKLARLQLRMLIGSTLALAPARPRCPERRGNSALGEGAVTSLRWRGISLILLVGVLFVAATARTNAGFFGHGGMVRAVAVSPDGRTVLTGSFDYTAKLWDFVEQREIATFDEHAGPVNAVAYLPDGTAALTASDDASAILWDLTTHAPLRQFNGHAAKVMALAVTRDGSRVATGGWDRTLRLWDIATGALLRTIEQPSNVNALAFVGDGETMLSGAHDGVIRLWNVASGVLIGEMSGHDWGITQIAVSPDGSRALTSGTDATLRLWDLESLSQIRRLEGHDGPVLGVAFSPDGETALSAGRDGYVIHWDLASGEALRTFGAHDGPVWAVAYTPDGRFAVSAGSDERARVWHLASGDQIGIEDDGPAEAQPWLASDHPGARLYRKCARCHALRPDGPTRAGPYFAGLFGRRAGSVAGYHYSDALLGLDFAWTRETLRALFRDGPDAFIPGTKMPMQRIADEAALDDLIDYMRELTATPKAGGAGD